MTKKQILAVDDEEDILELVQFNLIKEGYQVYCAASGDEALKLADAHLPDLIVLDLMHPDIDGLEITKILKAEPKTKDIPIVMLTAKGEEADIVTVLGISIVKHIVQAHGGHVSVDSEFGKGSNFSIHLSMG